MRSRHATQREKDNLACLVTEVAATLADHLRQAIRKSYTSESRIDSLILTLNALLRSGFATDATKASVLSISGDLAEMHKDTAHSDTYEEEHAMCGSDYCAGYHSDYAGQDWRPAKFDF